LDEYNIILTAGRNYKRLDHFLRDNLSDMTRSQIEKLIKNRQIQFNNEIIVRKSSEVHKGNKIEVKILIPPKTEYKPTIELKKIFEDPYLLIIDKPAGISVHPGSGYKQETILDVFRFLYPQINSMINPERPGIVHRLDKGTSGLLILSKDDKTLKKLQQQFKRREVKKTYLALIKGMMRIKHGRIEAAILRSKRDRRKFTITDDGESPQARDAVTDFSVWHEFSNFTLLKIFPLTGRTHQIRVPLSSRGYPILGDRLYNNRSPANHGMALHAYSIEFRHPISGHLIKAYSSMPELFIKIIKSDVFETKHGL